MVEEMRTEAMDLSANACEKHSTNNEVSSHFHHVIKFIYNLTLSLEF